MNYTIKRDDLQRIPKMMSTLVIVFYNTKQAGSRNEYVDNKKTNKGV